MIGQLILGGMPLVQLATFVVVVCAVVALVWIAMRQFGVSPPAWVVQVFWVIVVAFVIIFAIKLVAGF